MPNKVCELTRHFLARPPVMLAAIFLATRLTLLAVDVRFDAENLTTWMQIADVELLRTDLWNTLWYLHSQPPLYNFLIGILLPLGETGFAWAMGAFYAAVTLAGILALYSLARDLTGRPILAFVTSAWFCVAPSVLLFSHKLYYDGLVPWFLMLAFYGLHRGYVRHSFAWASVGFGMLAATVLLRSMIHPIVFCVVAAIYLTVATGAHRMMFYRAAALPALLIAFFMLKNAVLFGFLGLSSWAPINIGRQTIDRLPIELRMDLINQGRMSPYAALQESFAPPTHYLKIHGPIAPTGEPSLDNLYKSTGDYNWNHIVFLKAAEQRGRDASAAIAASPRHFMTGLATSLYHFHRPASEFKGLERNLAKISAWDRVTNAVVGLQPAALFGSWLDPARPASPLLQISYTLIGLTVAFALASTQLARDGISMLRQRRRPGAQHLALASMAAVGIFVMIVSSCFDVWENNRARFNCAPIYLVVAVWFVTRGREVWRLYLPGRARKQPV